MKFLPLPCHSSPCVQRPMRRRASKIKWPQASLTPDIGPLKAPLPNSLNKAAISTLPPTLYFKAPLRAGPDPWILQAELPPSKWMLQPLLQRRLARGLPYIMVGHWVIRNYFNQICQGHSMPALDVGYPGRSSAFTRFTSHA